MSSVMPTATVDLSGLQQAIPLIVAGSRRTLMEQCVTSLAYIVKNTQEVTPAASLSRIDSQLGATSTPILASRGKNKGQPLKSGKSDVSVLSNSVASKIVLARMSPNSKYSKMTGNRWPVARPDFHGRTDSSSAFWGYVKGVAERMVKARHSSTHFLQAGWNPALRQLFSNSFFRGSKKGSSGTENQLNSLPSDKFGGTALQTSLSDKFSVSAYNSIGENGNSVLGRKHRDALLKFGLPALEKGIARELSSINAKLEERAARELSKIKV